MCAAQLRDPRILLSRRVVDGTVFDKAFARNLRHGLVTPPRAIHAVVGHPADRGCGELPLGGDRGDLREAVGLRDHEHPLLGLGQQDLVRGHSRLPRGDEREVDLDPHTTPRRHLGGGRGKPCGAHVLNRHDVTRGDELEARLQQELLGEGIADLDLGPSLLAVVRQLLGRERGAVDPVPPSARSDDHEHVPHSARGGPDQVALPH